ncbi:ABC transporter ATP-binding protein [Deferribacterales bacterium RsTz2092]|nr:ABC transporter ATP-binding protein [Deferribacterales bacterium]
MAGITLSVEDASFSFSDGQITSLPNINASFGRILLVKGVIGSGKTLLLKALANIYQPKTGKLALLDAAGEKLPSCFINSQPEFNFITNSVKDELDLVGADKTPFAEYVGRGINELSGGEQKKLAVRIAMQLPNTSVLLLDEPLDMVDDVESELLASYIYEVSKNKPVIIATHDKHFDKMADEIITLGDTPQTNPILPARQRRCITELALVSLAPIALSVGNGELVCIYGRNGSGKTLFVKGIAGIGIRGYKSSHEWFVPRGERGFCLQFPEQMAFHNTITEEIADWTGINRASEVLDMLGWQGRGNVSPFALSDGERRIMFMFAMLAAKHVCVFDEPFAGFDAHSRAVVASRFYDFCNAGDSILYTANRRADTFYANKIIELK